MSGSRPEVSRPRPQRSRARLGPVCRAFQPRQPSDVFLPVTSSIWRAFSSGLRGITTSELSRGRCIARASPCGSETRSMANAPAERSRDSHSVAACSQNPSGADASRALPQFASSCSCGLGHPGACGGRARNRTSQTPRPLFGEGSGGANTVPTYGSSKFIGCPHTNRAQFMKLCAKRARLFRNR